MKALFTILLASLACSTFAQTDDAHNYTLKSSIVVNPYNPNGNIKEDNVLTARANQVFEVREIKKVNIPGKNGGSATQSNEDYYIVEFWYLPNAPFSTTFLNETNTGINFLYCISKSDFDSNCTMRYKILWYSKTFCAGALTVPFKIRPRKAGVPADIGTDLTLATSFGYKVRISRKQPNYLNVVGVFGGGSYSVDSLTTRGQYSLTTHLPGITYGFGAIIELNRVQISLLSCWDFIGGIAGKDWIYNKRNWVGFGIGYDLMKPKEIK